MTKKETLTLSKLEESLLTSLRSLDSQVARELQRTPEEETKHGVQKWEPITKRVELLSGFLLDRVGDNDINLESILILLQTLSKTLYILTDDLEVSGLGKVRSEYVTDTAKKVEYDCKRIIEMLRGQVVS